MLWLDLNVQRSQTTKAQGPLCYAFSRWSHLWSVSYLVTMATYVIQRKEIFSGNLLSKAVRKCGVSILTNEKVLMYKFLNYFGTRINSLFNICITKIIRISYDFVVPESALFAGFHEKRTLVATFRVFCRFCLFYMRFQSCQCPGRETRGNQMHYWWPVLDIIVIRVIENRQI